MRKYQNSSMRELAAELVAGLVRLRKGYIDAAEALVEIIDPRQDYPYDFVVYRLTGYRPGGASATPPLKGKPLSNDLQNLILDLCDSLDLKTTDYDGAVFDVPGLARKLSVSTKTIQRWRKRGLVARRLVFPDGRRRVAFTQHAVEHFTTKREKLVERSSHFSQLSDTERDRIIAMARELATGQRMSMSRLIKKLSAETGRAAETIRYTIRKHDSESPDEAVFPTHGPPLDDQEKMDIYQGFLGGSAAGVLARRYRRSRGSIYRVINEMRAQHLLNRQIDYIFNPQFDLPNADEFILAKRLAEPDPPDAPQPKAPGELPPYLRSLYEIPLLTPQQEKDLFRRYNYMKYKADRLRERIDPARARNSELRRVEGLLLGANVVKNQIVRANLRLVVSIAKKHLNGPMTLFELISDGNVSLMRAVEKFDYARGFRFSTYASWAIMRNYARTVPRERSQLDRFATGQDEVLDIAAGLRVYDPNELNLPELRESIDVMLSKLSALERSVLIEHYGLADESNAKTLEQLGDLLGISKERVRQIEIEALRKLRKALKPRQAELLS